MTRPAPSSASGETLLRFHKYEGLGNDFLLVDGARGRVDVRAICDRHRGVGADGVIFLDPQSLRMTVVNADGSEPEMCGNGLRCVALHWARTGRVMSAEFTVETDAGPHRCTVLAGTNPGRVAVGMRPATLEPREIPLASDHPWIDEAVWFGDVQLRVTAVSMGNPHAVLFDWTGDREVLALRIQNDASFPQSANVSFAKIGPNHTVDLAVFERGVGWTQACGTGACAVAVAAVERGVLPRGVPVDVRLPGGNLSITVRGPRDPIEMVGPARFVFEGTATLQSLGG